MQRAARLQTKLLLFWIGSILLLLLILWFLFRSLVINYHQESANTQFDHAFGLFQQLLDERIETLERKAVALAEREDIIASLNMLTHYQDREHYRPIIFDEEKKGLIGEIRNIAQINNLNLIALYDGTLELSTYHLHRDGSHIEDGYITYAGGKASLMGLGKDRHYQPQAKRPTILGERPSIKAGQPPFSHIHFIDNELILESYAVVTRQGRNDKPERVGAIKIMTFLDDDFSQSIAEKSALPFQLKIGNRYLFGSPPGFGNIKRLHQEIATTTASTTFSEQHTDRLRWHSNSQLIESSQLQLSDGHTLQITFAISQSGMANELAAFQKSSLLVLLLSALILLPAGIIYLRRSVTSPIGELVRAIESLRDGHFKRLPSPTRQDELGFVITSFNAMAFAIEQRELDLQKLSQAVEQSPVSIMITNPDGNIEYANRYFTQVSGYTLEELRGQNPRLFKSGHTTPKGYETLWATITSGKTWQGRLLNVKKSGERYWEATTITPIVDGNGKIIHFLGIKEDITERLRAEAELQRAQTEWASAMDYFEDAIYLIDLDDRVSRANQAFYNLTGLTPEQTIGKDITTILHPQGEEIPCPVCRARRERHNETVIMEADHPDNPTGRPIEVMVKIIRDQERNPAAVLMAIHDLTPTRQIEADMRIAASAFESNEGILITDSAANIVRVNDAFCHISGYSAEEVIGRNPSLLKSARNTPALYHEMWKQLLEQGHWRGEIWNQRKNGEEYPEWLSITAVKNEQGETTHYVAHLQDITERKAAQEQIEHQAYYDALTDLPNRRLLYDRLLQSIARSQRKHTFGAILFLDIDHFKVVNDSLGHQVGDSLVQHVAQTLQNNLRGEDTAARLGGDEFVVLVADLSSSQNGAANEAHTIATKIQEALIQPCQIEGHELHVTASIGITLFPIEESSPDDILKQADIAMYRAKANGRNTIQFYHPSMQEAAIERLTLEHDLRQAIARNELSLHYQPQVNDRGEMIGAEALLRWEHPTLGMVSPAKFIPIAEDTGLILPIGEWVLRTACQQLQDWAGNSTTDRLRLAVNVSPKQFNQPNFVEQVTAILREIGANPANLELELTEGMLIANITTVIERMHTLKLLGIHFSIDDFGTGYSSLSYIQRLPVDKLKIDQSFVRDIDSDSSDATIVDTIIAMSQHLGLDVIAEGVETETELAFLQEKGCRSYQGYYFAKPLPLEQLTPFIAQHPRH